MGALVDYPKLAYKYQQHHKRFERRVLNRCPKLICQDCKGMGGEIIPILDDGTGPFEECNWCERTGYVTPHLRGEWLRMKKEEKRHSI
jgi:hypothetical protein